MARGLKAKSGAIDRVFRSSRSRVTYGQCVSHGEIVNFDFRLNSDESKKKCRLAPKGEASFFKINQKYQYCVVPKGTIKGFLLVEGDIIVISRKITVVNPDISPSDEKKSFCEDRFLSCIATEGSYINIDDSEPCIFISLDEDGAYLEYENSHAVPVIFSHGSLFKNDNKGLGEKAQRKTAPIDELGQKTDEYAASLASSFSKNPEEAVSSLCAAFAKIGVIVSFSSVSTSIIPDPGTMRQVPSVAPPIKLPTAAPKLWADKPKGMTATEFVATFYAPWIEAGVLTLKAIGDCDPELSKAYSNRAFRHPDEAVALVRAEHPRLIADPREAAERYRSKARESKARYRSRDNMTHKLD